MKRRSVLLQKPKALREGSRIAVISPSSPAEPTAVCLGMAELRRLGFEVEELPPLPPQGYFAGPHEELVKLFRTPFHDKSVDGVIATRGGYGANYLIDLRLGTSLFGPKCLIGFSDLNVIQLLLYRVRSWAGFYGPMVPPVSITAPINLSATTRPLFCKLFVKQKPNGRFRCAAKTWFLVALPGALSGVA